jgi:hypothetical protein
MSKGCFTMGDLCERSLHELELLDRYLASDDWDHYDIEVVDPNIEVPTNNIEVARNPHLEWLFNPFNPRYDRAHYVQSTLVPNQDEDQKVTT